MKILHHQVSNPSAKSHVKPPVKSPVTVNLLDDSINDTIITKEAKKKNELNANNSNSLNTTPEKSKDSSTLSLGFEDMASSPPSDDLNQQSFFSNFKDQVLPESSSSNNNTVS